MSFLKKFKAFCNSTEKNLVFKETKTFIYLGSDYKRQSKSSSLKWFSFQVFVLRKKC